ncbi:MAG TPA: DICT sensory domain-containing protein [Pyrinomonadaceae bacterium]
MYECALAAAAGRAVADLGAVAALSRQTLEEHTTLRWRTQPPCLEYVSLLIETALLLRAHRAGRVYVGFERLSRMEPIVARYLRIADVSERLYVFGEPDWQPPRHPHMKALKVPAGAPLAREWFVIADSPTLQVALVARDLDGFVAPALDARNFDAIKSHDPHVVARLAAAAERLVDQEVRG